MDHRRRYSCDIQEIKRKPYELPYSVRVDDRQPTQNHVKYGDTLTIYKTCQVSGFVVHHERGEHFMFIPSSYNGTFCRSPTLYPQAEDLKEAGIKEFVKATRNWSSPFSNADSVYLDDTMRVISRGFITISHHGVRDELEVLICRLRDEHTKMETKTVKIPMCAEGYFEKIEDPRTDKIFQIKDFSESLPERVVVRERGSSEFKCEREYMIREGRRMEIQSEITLHAVVVQNENNKKVLELFSTDVLKVIPVEHSAQPSKPRDGAPIIIPRGAVIGRTLHIITAAQAQRVREYHLYASIDDQCDELDIASARAIPEQAVPAPPGRRPIHRVKPSRRQDDIDFDDDDYLYPVVTMATKGPNVAPQPNNSKVKPPIAPRRKKTGNN